MRIHEQTPIDRDPTLRDGAWGDALAPGPTASDGRSQILHRDLRMLIRFIEIYCSANHAGVPKDVVTLNRLDVAALASHDLRLCPRCTKLCLHALTKRAACPLDPKPSCKHCPQHCYRPSYRRQIQEVMRFSGMHLVLRGRLDYLVHLLF